LDENLSKQDEKEMLYLSMILLISGDQPISSCWMRNSIVPELVHILEPEALIALMQNFSGQRIMIPKIEDMQRSAKVIYYYYYHEIKGMDQMEALKKVGLKKDDIRIVPARVERLKKFFRDNAFKLPDSLSKSPMMKEINEDLCKEE
jgi:hypothetical protein